MTSSRRVAPPPGTEAEPTRNPALAAPPRPLILLAEDDAEMRALLARALRRVGYDVVECRDGLDLLEKIVAYAPNGGAPDFDLIISDIRMPGITGLSLLEDLQQWKELGPLRMILITAFGDDEVHTRARELGAVALFDKPFEIDDLLAKAKEILDRDPATISRGAAHERALPRRTTESEE